MLTMPRRSAMMAAIAVLGTAGPGQGFGRHARAMLVEIVLLFPMETLETSRMLFLRNPLELIHVHLDPIHPDRVRH